MCEQNKFVSRSSACPYCNFVENTCRCENGVPQIGSGCPIHGAANCLACLAGRTLSHDRTECIGACLRYNLNDPVRMGIGIVACCCFDLQSMAVPAIMASLKPGPVALWMVLRNARRARLGGQSTTHELRVFVRMNIAVNASE